MCMLDAVMGFF